MNLADELKKLAEDDTPDLWERIEAQLNEPPVSATVRKQQEITAGDVKVIKLGQTSFHGKRRFLRRYGGLIAACFTAVILLPVLYLNVFDGNLNDGILPLNFESISIAPKTAGDTEPSLSSPEATFTDNQQDSGAILSPENIDDIANNDAAGLFDTGGSTSNTNRDTVADSQIGGERDAAYLFRAGSGEANEEIANAELEIISFQRESTFVVYTATVINDENEILNTDINIDIIHELGLGYSYEDVLDIGVVYHLDLLFDEIGVFYLRD
ncbi:MAG: hypothetical protein LBC96_07025 [Lachnospiraceae bacterium]|jgi:hypothetical protein|nr:hypothetical protein [Lachnospiraceae bacterium]